MVAWSLLAWETGKSDSTCHHVWSEGAHPPVSKVLEDQIKSSLFPVSQTPQSAEVTASDIWPGGSEDKNNDTLKER